MEQRVLEGGHFVEPKTIKGVYQKNLYHIDEFKKTFKVIELYDGMKLPTLLAKIEDDQVVMAMPMAMKKSWIKSGLPSISTKLSAFINT